jgi:hypothetical protein
MVSDSLRRAHHFFSDVLGRKSCEPITLEQTDGTVDIRVGRSLLASVPVENLALTAWDQRRFVELLNRIVTKGSIYSTLSAAIWVLPGEEARLTAQLAGRRTDLSRNFRELLRLVDRAVGIRLSDHFRSRSRERVPGATKEDRMARR